MGLKFVDLSSMVQKEIPTLQIESGDSIYTNRWSSWLIVFLKAKGSLPSGSHLCWVQFSFLNKAVVACIFFTELPEHIVHLCPSPSPGWWAVGPWFSALISGQHHWSLMLHSELNPFITCMTSPLAWSQWGGEHMPMGNADELRSLPGLISVALLCGVHSIVIYTSTGDNFCTKMLTLVSLFLIYCLSLPRTAIQSVAQWSASLACHPKDRSLRFPQSCLFQVSLQTWGIRRPLWWSLRWLPLHVTTKAISWYHELPHYLTSESRKSRRPLLLAQNSPSSSSL